MFFSTLFSVFWVKTSNMDAKSQAHNISSSGLQVAGFRQDERIIGKHSRKIYHASYNNGGVGNRSSGSSD